MKKYALCLPLLIGALFSISASAASDAEQNMIVAGVESLGEDWDLELEGREAVEMSCSTTATDLLWAAACIETIKERETLNKEYQALKKAARDAKDGGDSGESARLLDEALAVKLEMNGMVEQYKFCKELFAKLLKRTF